MNTLNMCMPFGNTGIDKLVCIMLVLVKLIGVNKGRHVTLKYFSILTNIDKEHRHFIGSEKSLIVSSHEIMV